MRLSIVAASLAFMVVALIPERSEARAGNCPHGYRWSYKYKTCKAICPPGQKPDATGRCQEVRDSCPDGFFWSRTEGRCMNRCRPGTTWSTAQSRCVGVERPAPRCGPGWAWSAYYNRCIRASRCPTGTRWNGTYCEAWRACPAGYYFSSYFNSCRPQVRSCLWVSVPCWLRLRAALSVGLVLDWRNLS